MLVAENPDDATDPVTYLPVEFRFPEGETFKHFGMKWESYVDMNCVPVTDEALIVRLQAMGKKVFLGVEGASYGRADIRMNEQGELFILEMNPNCGIFYPPEAMGSADLALMHDPRGHYHFVDMILRAALKRARKIQKKWQVVLNSEQRYGMYATSSIPRGEIIEILEERPHVLVSKRHVEQNWGDQQKQWFARYAYPITDEIYVMWSNDPSQWKPVNHSCDPNACFDGLVPRRDPRDPGGGEVSELHWRAAPPVA